MSERSDGEAAGRSWARTADKLELARLRSWFPTLCELDAWDPSMVYSCLLTNKSVTDNTGDNANLVASKEAYVLGLDFFRHFDGWPGYDSSEFIEGFVRGAMEV